MRCYDVFNGDADGICALHQLRLDSPRDTTLITGVKRDIRLLEKIKRIQNAKICVLDISMDANRDSLLLLLNQGNSIVYYDHHYSGLIPDSPRLDAHIDASADVCTSILVNRFLDSRYIKWAIVAAFGDNLHHSAEKLSEKILLPKDSQHSFKELGELLNYNSYGNSTEDLYFHPETLYREIKPFKDPMEFIESSPLLDHLKRGYASDMNKAQSIKAEELGISCRVFLLPDAAWARRVVGVFSNLIANQNPQKAHAILVENSSKSYLVSIRAPIEFPVGADKLSRQFSGGGGVLLRQELMNFLILSWKLLKKLSLISLTVEGNQTKSLVFLDSDSISLQHFIQLFRFTPSLQ